MYKVVSDYYLLSLTTLETFTVRSTVLVKVFLHGAWMSCSELSLAIS